MDPQKLFPENPPREPLTSLAAVVRDWQWRFIEGDASKYRDEVVEYCKKAPDLGTAIVRACRSRRPNGKMHNHQSKVPEKVRSLFSRNIMNLTVDPKWMTNFDILYDTLHKVKPHGIGPVTLYDVATRIGAYLAVEPRSLYLKAGTLDGWRELGLGVSKDLPRAPDGVPRPGPEYWPNSLRALPADQVEDLLCAYRAIFPNLERQD